MTARDGRDWFEEGWALFNEGRFFECHEAWEEVWKRSDGDEKLFYQGLIQAAVAILHAQRGNLQGARSILEKSLAKLDAMPAEHMGIALGELRDGVTQFVAAAARGDGRPLPKPPRLRRLPKSGA
jgi:predicted metal-dependent hydrolase